MNINLLKYIFEGLGFKFGKKQFNFGKVEFYFNRRFADVRCSRKCN